MPKKSKDNPLTRPGNDVLMASYKAGFADGRLEAIEESMDTVAGLIFKAEALIAGLGNDGDSTIRDNATHTLRALHLAFAAVTGSKAGSEAFIALLEQSRERLQRKSA